MISRTGMTEWVRNFQFKEVRAGLAEKPDLLDFRDERGRSWLHLCCSVNPKSRRLKPAASIKTAEVLLEAGLGIDDAAFTEGKWRATPLWYAVARGENNTLARSLLKQGCDPNHCLSAAAYRRNADAIRFLVAAGARVDEVAEDETPFLGAIKSSHFREAKLLLELGANVNHRNAAGMTALHYMLKKGSDARHFPMLIAHGARGDIKNREGETAHAILSRKRSPAFKKLAEQLAGS